jgi:hypothetical protein
MGYADIKTSECYVHLVDVRKRAAVEAKKCGHSNLVCHRSRIAAMLATVNR